MFECTLSASQTTVASGFGFQLFAVIKGGPASENVTLTVKADGKELAQKEERLAEDGAWTFVLPLTLHRPEDAEGIYTVTLLATAQSGVLFAAPSALTVEVV